MKNITHCPICKSPDFSPYLSCKDYTCSGEQFNLVQCSSCDFVFTNPVPKEEEIGSYYQSEEYISHSNTSKGIINSLYKTVRNITIQQKLKLVGQFNDGKKLLDIGCGTGEFLNSCQKAGYDVKGVEPSEIARKQAQDNYGLQIETEEILNNTLPNSIDLITMWHVLEHVYPLNDRMASIKKLLKPKGVAFIAVPNRNSFDAKHYGEFWAAYDVPRHLYHFTPKNIFDLCKKFELQLIKTLPMKFDAFYVSMLSEKYKNNGKANLLKAFWIGLLSNLKAKKEESYSSQIYILQNPSEG